jgi:hypothetical protein
MGERMIPYGDAPCKTRNARWRRFARMPVGDCEGTWRPFHPPAPCNRMTAGSGLVPSGGSCKSAQTTAGVPSLVRVKGLVAGSVRLWIGRAQFRLSFGRVMKLIAPRRGYGRFIGSVVDVQVEPMSVLGRPFIAIQGPVFERGSWNVCITRQTTGYGHDTLNKRLA